MWTEILKTIVNTPLPVILIIAGLFFLFLAVGGQFGAKIVTDRVKQKYAGIIGVFLMIIGLGLWISGHTVKSGPEIKKVIVPNVINLPLEKAQDILASIGLQPGSIEMKEDKTVDAGVVLDQNPEAGKELNEGEAVDLVVAAKSEKVVVPKVIDLSLQAAQTALENARLTLGKINKKESADTVTGHVIDQFPREGTEVFEGEAVNVVITAKPEDVFVPSVLRMTLNNAKEILSEARLELGNIFYRETSDFKPGHVIDQNPRPGEQVPQGQRVHLTVSTEPEKVTVPSLTELSVERAEKILAESGLRLGKISYKQTDTHKPGHVLDQRPKPGERVPGGKTVDLLVAEKMQIRLPDLYVSEFSLSPDPPVQGRRVSVRVGVYNKGNAASGPFTVEWWAGENFPKPACSWKVEGLPARGGEILKCTYKGYRSWYGRLTTLAIIDPQNIIKELDKTNNKEKMVIKVNK